MGMGQALSREIHRQYYPCGIRRGLNQTRLNVSDDIGRILKKERKPAILVTHDISEAISMADRVIILTKRPATVARIVTIDLGLTDRTPLSSRNAPQFKSYFNLIWKELNQYV